MLGPAGLGPWLPGDLTEQGFYSSFWEVGDDSQDFWKGLDASVALLPFCLSPGQHRPSKGVIGQISTLFGGAGL